MNQPRERWWVAYPPSHSGYMIIKQDSKADSKARLLFLPCPLSDENWKKYAWLRPRKQKRMGWVLVFAGTCLWLSEVPTNHSSLSKRQQAKEPHSATFLSSACRKNFSLCLPHRRLCSAHAERRMSLEKPSVRGPGRSYVNQDGIKMITDTWSPHS